jgi:hypothetical protein
MCFLGHPPLRQAKLISTSPGKDKPQQLIQTTYYKKQNGDIRALHIGGTIRPFDEEPWKRLVIALTYYLHEQKEYKASSADKETEGQGFDSR